MFKYLSTKHLEMGKDYTVQFDGAFISETD